MPCQSLRTVDQHHISDFINPDQVFYVFKGGRGGGGGGLCSKQKSKSHLKGRLQVELVPVWMCGTGSSQEPACSVDGP